MSTRISKKDLFFLIKMCFIRFFIVLIYYFFFKSKGVFFQVEQIVYILYLAHYSCRHPLSWEIAWRDGDNYKVPIFYSEKLEIYNKNVRSLRKLCC